jgi:hypothetical protein
LESEWRAASVETCRIINVNIEDWTVDCISELGNKRYFDVQVMSPYFHFANGEGVYVQPEVGSLVWVCVPSSGRFAAPFVLGFQSAHDSEFDGFRGGRQNLNPGDIMLRTRDENFLVLRRGGVVQIGATPAAQRVYLPIRNFIKDFCENYGLFTFGGDLTWNTERDDQTTDGTALTKFSLKAKEKASNSAYVATLSIGSHGEGKTTTLLLEIFESGDEGAAVAAHLDISKEGNVRWEVKKKWELVVSEEDIVVTASKGAVTIDARDTFTAQAQKDVLLTSTSAKATLSGSKEATVRSSAKAQLDAPVMHLGSGATSPLVKGDKLVSLLSTLITQISAFTCASPGSPVVAAPAVASLTGQLANLLSTTSFTK